MPTYECPTCNKNVTVPKREDAPFRPFCSERCKLIDLGRWFDGDYCVSDPIRPDDLDQGATPPPADEAP